MCPLVFYSQSDRTKGKRTSLSLKLTIDMIKLSGASKIITFDLHTAECQLCGPIVNVSPRFMVDDALARVSQYIEGLLLVAPDTGSCVFVQEFSKSSGQNLILFDKRRSDGRLSVTMVGKVVQTAVIAVIDDMSDTGSTISHVLSYLCMPFIEQRHVIISHSIFSCPPLFSGHTSNSVPLANSGTAFDICPLLAEQIINSFQ